MTAATNPLVVSFTTANGATPQSFTTVPPQWRWLQVDNNTSQAASITITPGDTNDTTYVFPVAAGAAFATGMGTALPNANFVHSGGNDVTLYQNGVSVLPSTGALQENVGQVPSPVTGFCLDQSNAFNWTAQSTLSAVAFQYNSISVVLAGNPAANSTVVLSWL